MTEEQETALRRVEAAAQQLCRETHAAVEAGVPDALLLPALLAVFREAGMLPDIDLGGLLGLLK